MKVTTLIMTILAICSVSSLGAAVNSKNYSQMDKDGDGKWSYNEYVQYRMGGFKKMDTNKDGMVEASEAWNTKFITAADTDKDGKISSDEAAATHLKIAGSVDKNKDGFISIEELNPGKN